MKRTWMFLLMFPSVLNAVSCPSGMVALEYDNYVEAVAGVCPSGYVAHDVVDVCADVGSGSVCWVVQQLRTLCASGISNIKTSTGVSIPLYAEKYSVPALHVKYNNAICYGSLAAGQASGAINLKFNGKVYHMVE